MISLVVSDFYSFQIVYTTFNQSQFLKASGTGRHIS